jgi:hypothetical protein
MADVMPALTDVSPEAQKLMTACEGVLWRYDTGSDAHDSANAAFEKAASQLEEASFLLAVGRQSAELDFGGFPPRLEDNASAANSSASTQSASPLCG